MAEETDQSDKTEEPSTYRIEEFRKRGEVASSRELTSVLVLLACLLSITLSLVFIYETISEFLEWLYTLDVAYAFTEKSLKLILKKTAFTGFKCAAPVLATALAVGVFSNVMQIGILYAPDALDLNWQRIDPISGLKRLFSVRSVVEAIKGLFKFIIILGITYIFLRKNVQSYSGFLHGEFLESFVLGKELLVGLGMTIVFGLFVIAVGDFAYQKLSYRKKLMLSKEEAKREHREHEGNPEIKQRIKTVQRQIAQKRMLADIAKADVIVTNPTHLSVALWYDKDTMVSPQVVAKGADFLALRIREIAKDKNIPIVENVPLARSLYKTVKVGTPVPRALYKAVAEVLAFVYKLRRRQKALE